MFRRLIPIHPSGFTLEVFLPEALPDPLTWTFISPYEKHNVRIGFIYPNVAYTLRKDRECVCLGDHGSPCTQLPEFSALTSYSIHLGQTDEIFRADEVQNMSFSHDCY